MHKSAHTVAYIDKRSEVLEALDHSVYYRTDGKPLYLLAPLLIKLLLKNFAARQHKLLILLIDCYDNSIDRLSNILCRIFHIVERKLRCRNESAYSFKIAHNPCVHSLGSLNAHASALSLPFAEFLPSRLMACLLLR